MNRIEQILKNEREANNLQVFIPMLEGELIPPYYIFEMPKLYNYEFMQCIGRIIYFKSTGHQMTKQLYRKLQHLEKCLDHWISRYLSNKNILTGQYLKEHAKIKRGHSQVIHRQECVLIDRGSVIRYYKMYCEARGIPVNMRDLARRINNVN